MAPARLSGQMSAPRDTRGAWLWALRLGLPEAGCWWVGWGSHGGIRPASSLPLRSFSVLPLHFPHSLSPMSLSHLCPPPLCASFITLSPPLVVFHAAWLSAATLPVLPSPSVLRRSLRSSLVPSLVLAPLDLFPFLIFSPSTLWVPASCFLPLVLSRLQRFRRGSLAWPEQTRALSAGSSPRPPLPAAPGQRATRDIGA